MSVDAAPPYPSNWLSRPVLVADVGGTNVRFALARNGHYDLARTLRADDFDSFDEVMAELWEPTDPTDPPMAVILAVACPPEPEELCFTNRAWRFTKSEIRRRYGLDALIVMNDFAAIAHALPHLSEQDTQAIGGGEQVDFAAMAVVGAGTGLGVAGLTASGGDWMPVSGEGGHVTLATRNDREAAVVAALTRRYGHVSAERVLSGPGLSALHDAILEIDGYPPRPLVAADIVDLAGRDASATETLDLFADFLGTVGSDVALTFGARGGLFIGGGVVPRMAGKFPAARFRARFEDKGRFSGYCANIRTRLITHSQPALLGLARAAPALVARVTG